VRPTVLIVDDHAEFPQGENPTLAEPGWPAASGEWSFSSQSWREQ
jgi:hypothetical protein